MEEGQDDEGRGRDKKRVKRKGRCVGSEEEAEKQGAE